MLATILLIAALVTPTPEPPFQPGRYQLIASASGMAKYKPVLGPMIARAMLVDVVTSAGPRTIASFGGGGSLGGDLYLLDLVDLKLASTSTIQWSATTDPTAAKDLGFSRPSVGLVKVTNGASGIGSLESGRLTLTALATPATPVITNGGAAGVTAYSYVIVAKLPDVTTTTQAGSPGTTLTGNAVLDGTNYNIITWAATSNAHCYDVWRTAGGATQGKIATCTTSPLNDTGLAGVGAGTQPIFNLTGIAVSNSFNPVGTGTAAGAVNIGYSSSAAGSTAIAIGQNSSAVGISNIMIGASATATGDYSTAVGGIASIGGGTTSYAAAFGYGASIGANSLGSIAIGSYATVPASTPNTYVSGYSTIPINNVYFGKGITHAAPTAYTINGTGGSGADIVGGDLQLAPGISTGLAVPGRVKIRKTASIGTGNTPQTVSDLAYFGGVPLSGATAFFGMDGTFSDTAVGTQYGMLFNITAAGGASVVDNYGMNLALQDGASSPANSFAFNLSNQINTGNTYGLQVDSTSATAGIGIASTGQFIGGAFASSATGNYATTVARTAGLNAGLVASNGAIVGPIFLAADNVTPKWTIEDNGAVWAKTCEKALVSATPTEFVQITMPASGRQGGVLEYCVDANDASNYQTRCGIIPFTFINEASTEACTVGTTSDSDGTPTGTLTTAITAASAANNTCGLLANADSSLAETTLRINAHIRLLGNAATAVACQ